MKSGGDIGFSIGLYLTHSPKMPYIWAIIGSVDDLLPVWCQAIIFTNIGLLCLENSKYKPFDY